MFSNSVIVVIIDHKQPLFWIILAINTKKKQICQKIFGNHKSYELSAHFQLLSFEYSFTILGELKCQMKSDVTRVIKQITFMSSCDIFEFYAYYKRLQIK